MLIVGLTGGIGSGKSTVACFFEELGIEVVDADLLAREVVEPGTTALGKITERFGTDLNDSNGKLKRSKLREIIFDDPEQKAWLEELLHPLIAELTKSRLAACTSAYCILASPLLLETEQHKFTDRILVIDVSEQTQLQRTSQRDGSDASLIESIIASQLGRRERLQRADDIIDNDNDIDGLRTRVAEIHEQYLKFAQSGNALNEH